MIPDTFNLMNVTDTCALWHVVGADTLFRTARRASVGVIITPTVSYECFVKTRGHVVSFERQALRAKLRAHLEGDEVTKVGVSIDDLQEAVDAARRAGFDKRLGQGELSCAALARKLGRPAVLTDNKRDFAAIAGMVDGRLQKTPQLLGWLYVEGHLNDPDVADVLREHEASKGPLGKVYKEAHRMACEKRLMDRTEASGGPEGQ